MVVASVTVVALALTIVAGWMMARDARLMAAERQDANMRVAWDVLGDYGSAFSARDGRLYVGSTPLNGLVEPVDRIKTLVGGTATVFQGDTRITTNVKKDDGSRAVGTKLNPGPVYDAVLRDGKPYRGQADILGKPYFVAYDPIKDASGAVVGVLYVGIPEADFMATVNQMLLALFGVGAVVALVVLGGCLYLSRRMFAPLGELRQRMEALQQGRLDISVPWAARSDDIGQIARAVVSFRDAAVKRLEMETEAEALRETAKAERIAAEQERHRIAEEDAVVVAALGEGLSSLARGDLTHRIRVDFVERSRQLKDDYNAAMDALGQT
ncbi:hypothetical protein CCR92_18950, partial [Rhodospirillum rubrum]|nr:hypothetical protein [Rhodospirillum rubrum]